MASTFERVINIARDGYFSSNPEALICLDGLSFSDRQIEKEDDQSDVGDRSQRAFIGGRGGRGGGGSGGGDGDGSSGYWDSNHGNNIMEEYYQKMIDAYPGDALLLSNYAKFLKEVKT